MCKTEAVVHRCGCTIEQPIKRCRRAKDAFADHQRKRFFEWSAKKRKRQSAFSEHYTKDGYCRDLDRHFFPSSSLCHSHQIRYDGAQSFPRTNPRLHPDRDDGLIFVETNAYDRSGKMLPRHIVPRVPQPTYHPHQISPSYSAPNTRAPPPIGTRSSSPERSSPQSRTRTKKDLQNKRDREDEARTKKILKEAERLDRDRGKTSKSRDISKSVEDIRRRAIARSSRERSQHRQQAPPVPVIPNFYDDTRPDPFRASLVPAPLNISKKTVAVPNTATATSFPPSSSSSYYYDQRQVSTTDTTSSSHYTYPTFSTSYYDPASPPPEPPRPNPRVVEGFSYPPTQVRPSSARDNNAHHTSSTRTRAPSEDCVADAVTWYGAATHPRVARPTYENVSSSGAAGSGGGSTNPHSYRDEGSSSRHGRSERERLRSGRTHTTATAAPPPLRERAMYR